MKNLLEMTLAKAERMSDDEIGKEIAQLESGQRKLRVRTLGDDLGPGRLDLSPIILKVFRQVQESRKNRWNSRNVRGAY